MRSRSVCVCVLVCLSDYTLRVKDLHKDLEELPEILEDEEQVCLRVSVCVSLCGFNVLN